MSGTARSPGRRAQILLIPPADVDMDIRVDRETLAADWRKEVSRPDLVVPQTRTRPGIHLSAVLQELVDNGERAILFNGNNVGWWGNQHVIRDGKLEYKTRGPIFDDELLHEHVRGRHAFLVSTPSGFAIRRLTLSATRCGPASDEIELRAKEPLPGFGLSGFPLLRDYKTVWQTSARHAWDPRLLFDVRPPRGAGRWHIRKEIQAQLKKGAPLVRHALTVVGVDLWGRLVLLVDRAVRPGRGHDRRRGGTPAPGGDFQVGDAIVLGAAGDAQLATTEEGFLTAPLVEPHTPRRPPHRSRRRCSAATCGRCGRAPDRCRATSSCGPWPQRRSCGSGSLLLGRTDRRSRRITPGRARDRRSRRWRRRPPAWLPISPALLRRAAGTTHGGSSVRHRATARLTPPPMTTRSGRTFSCSSTACSRPATRVHHSPRQLMRPPGPGGCHLLRDASVDEQLPELGIGDELAVDEEGAPDTGTEGEHQDRVLVPAGRAVVKFRHPGRVRIVEHGHRTSVQRLAHQLHGVHVDPRLGDVDGAAGDAAVHRARQCDADGAGAGPRCRHVRHGGGDGGRRGGARGVDLAPLRAYPAVDRVDDPTLDPGRADVDPDDVALRHSVNIARDGSSSSTGV